ncbi:unnamed protein product [Polarella glacialis]|uniref:RRM domain-containing protein n=1 Tax=Polarella glacialis TaxID=89957 RepID=A0A813KRS3_POLGL|nr:unnamed protein product [Polarella glacialis]
MVKKMVKKGVVAKAPKAEEAPKAGKQKPGKAKVEVKEEEEKDEESEVDEQEEEEEEDEDMDEDDEGEEESAEDDDEVDGDSALKVFIGNIPWSQAEEAELRKKFGKCGEIAKVELPFHCCPTLFFSTAVRLMFMVCVDVDKHRKCNPLKHPFINY